MNYKAYIVNNETGEGRWYSMGNLDWFFPDGTCHEYLWQEGNFGCDCNRHLFWNRAVGIEPEDERPCGETRYTIPYIELDSGERISIDEGLRGDER